MEQTQVTTDTLVSAIVESIQNKRGQHVVSIDLRKLNSSVCDFFIICSAESDRQASAIADGVEKDMKEHYDTRAAHKEGMNSSHWIVLDFLDVVVHIFQPKYRDFYRLEDLWADADIKEYSDSE